MWYRKFQKQCRWLALSGLVFICIFSYFLIVQTIPDDIRIVVGREETFDLGIPVKGRVEALNTEVFTNQSQRVQDSEIYIDMQDTFTLKSTEEGSFSIVCKLFGVFSLKEVSVEVINQEMVVPCGIPVGIYVETDGILAIGAGTVTGMDGMNYEPAHNLIKSGDYIKTINDQVINTKEELVEKVNCYGKEDIVLGVVRNGEYTRIKIKPIQTGVDEYKIGVWVRDDMAGVGTMTYYTTDMQYAALGHPVSDADTSTTIQLGEGLLYETEILGITKGEKGKPGELSGVIDYQTRYCMGTVSGNLETGIYGELQRLPLKEEDVEYMSIGLKQEMELGQAEIISYVSGVRETYDIEITSLDFNSQSVNKGIQFRVTDERLLSLTGGIVQGMSGSPIIQNGKLIGAVTHVFVNNPKEGYGIFAEIMMEECYNNKISD